MLSLNRSNFPGRAYPDRIVTGYPDNAAEIEQQLGYHDAYLVAAEVYYLLVIQGPDWLEHALRLDRYPLNVRSINDIRPFKERKVAILNGAHTAVVPVAVLAGLNTVGEAMADRQIAAFCQQMLRQEVAPTLKFSDELDDYVDTVLNRFRNPFICHPLQSIALNGMSKFRTRLLPQLLNSLHERGTPPECLTFAFAALLVYYRGRRDAGAYPLQDEPVWLQRFHQPGSQVDARQLTPRQLVETVLGNASHWGENLNEREEVAAAVTAHLQRILTEGVRAALASVT